MATRKAVTAVAAVVVVLAGERVVAEVHTFSLAPCLGVGSDLLLCFLKRARKLTYFFGKENPGIFS